MRKKLFIFLFLTILLAACTRKPDSNSAVIVEDGIEYYLETASNTSYPDQNFAILFEYGSCNNDILDTFEGTFTKDMIVDPVITIPFEIADTQMTQIYQKMLEIGFFEYPDIFSIQTSKDEEVGIVTPATEYRITVRNGDLTKTLFWIDDIIDPNTPEAENLRSLFRLIIDLIQNSPEYQRLPQLEAGCA